jgi:hypothetical protein
MIGAQRTLVLQHLQRGGTLTALQALDLYGIGRLAARIEELRRAGYDITTEMVATPGGARVAEYRLVEKPVPARALRPGEQGRLFDPDEAEIRASWRGRI